MTLGFFQRIQLFLIFRVVDTFRFLEYLGAIPIYTVIYSIRAISMVALVLFIGGSFDYTNSYEINSLSYIFDSSKNYRVLSNQQVLGASSAQPPEYKGGSLAFPSISASSALAVDVRTGTVLYHKNEYEKHAPASTTKLMTALVAMDLYDLSDLLVVPEFCTILDSQKAGYLTGEKVSVKDLLYSMLIGSAGDAACTLSANAPQGSDFLSFMNDKTKQLEMNSTNFTNSIGLDDADFKHFSTAFDMYLLGKAAMKEDLIKEAVLLKTYQFGTSFGLRSVYNTNALLWEIPSTVGIKTGRTEGAGEVLIYEYKNDQTDLIIVVMGSLDRFGDTKILLDWLLESFTF